MSQFSRAIPVLPVRDIDAACAWYRNALGLETVYKHEGTHKGEATNYAVLERDDVQIHLILDEPPPYADTWTAAGSGYLYLRVLDVAELHQVLQDACIPLVQELMKSNWGARGFEFRDPDGNLIRVEQQA